MHGDEEDEVAPAADELAAARRGSIEAITPEIWASATRRFDDAGLANG